ncbi:MAG: hypothetical protein AAB428_03680 [Patescibacteria group bacterium]
MKKYGKELAESQAQISLLDFLKSYNKNIPVSFPKATASLLKKFKESHPMLFKNGDFWSLDQHRKKTMDWLPRNTDSSS